MQIELNENQKTEIVSRVIAALQTNSVAISDLTQVSTVSSGDYIEVSGGKRIAVSAIIDAVIAAIGGGGGGGGGSTITVDNELKSNSTNPVQNQVIYTALGGKVAKATSFTAGRLAKLTNEGGIEDSGYKITDLTQADYDDLSSKDDHTIYLIKATS